MSQPRNFLGGQMLSALVGITTRVVIHQPWIAGPVGMSLALLLMQVCQGCAVLCWSCSGYRGLQAAEAGVQG